MIIAFYPGAGGNRLYHYLGGKRDFSQFTTYDHLLKNQSFDYRYLTNDTVGLPDQDLILTHCVNVPLLTKHFPNHSEIIVVVGDLNLCLRREWTLEEQYRDKDFTSKLEHASATLQYHHRYYTDFCLDTTGATKVIDITTDSDEFALMMKQEIESIDSPYFDQAIDNFRPLLEHSIQGLSGDKIVNGNKSKFLNDAEIMQHELGPALCLAKWKQVSLHLATGLNNSCYHPPLHVIPIESIVRNPSALHNTEHKKEQRRLMLNNERPTECSYCWAMEDNGKLSDRHYRSGEPWAQKDFGKIVSADWQDDIVPSYVEVNFNHGCNLACSYCSPQFSSTWQAEVERDGGYPTTVPHNDPAHFTGNRRPIPNREVNPYVEAFWKWWPTLYPELEHFRMTGGEPLMDKNTYRVFDYVLANPSPKLHLNVTSNFSVEQKLWDKYLSYVKQLCEGEKIEHFMQYVSVDTWGSQAEYIRHGLDFNLLWDRVNQFLTEVPGRSSITFIVTMNNLSVTNLGALFAGILGLRKVYSKTYQRVWFDTPVLRQPAWQSLQILPESYVEKLEYIWAWMISQTETLETRFQGFKDYEVQRLDRDIAWMKQGVSQQDREQRMADFYKFFAEHDRRRGTDFLATFPEMCDFWNQCEYYAKTR
jgi:organic radical activating enzyme